MEWGRRMLEVSDLTAGYGRTRALHGISFSIKEGAVTVLLGANGAGKTTVLRAVSGAIWRKGRITLGGEDISSLPPHAVAGRGVAHVIDGRGTFGDMTVTENLSVGLYTVQTRAKAEIYEEWFERFPILGRRRSDRAGLLSGGEQQMLAIARALVLRPRLLLLDEPSLGISPKVTGEIFQVLAEINANQGVTMLLVEQNVDLALGIGTDVHILEGGEIVVSGEPESIREDPKLRQSYLGY